MHPPWPQTQQHPAFHKGGEKRHTFGNIVLPQTQQCSSSMSDEHTNKALLDVRHSRILRQKCSDQGHGKGCACTHHERGTDGLASKPAVVQCLASLGRALFLLELNIHLATCVLPATGTPQPTGTAADPQSRLRRGTSRPNQGARACQATQRPSVTGDVSREGSEGVRGVECGCCCESGLPPPFDAEETHGVGPVSPLWRSSGQLSPLFALIPLWNASQCISKSVLRRGTQRGLATLEAQKCVRSKCRAAWSSEKTPMVQWTSAEGAQAPSKCSEAPPGQDTAPSS